MVIISLRRSFIVSSLFKRMASSDRSYEAAIHKLNSLQSNKSTLEQIRKALKSGQEKCRNIQAMEDYLLRTGISLSQLDELSVIHVAGTKGKGSTSAMCESILRRHGLRTGLYTSPHLVAVRERVRLAGAVVGRRVFAAHFHRVYDMLYDTQAFDGDMPKYFAFLTVLAFNMFLSEKVDVAIVEVGIGGGVDYTNVLRKVPVVGITALGLDHTSILGKTIEEISLAKAGIMKPGCEAYTVDQPQAAMAVLRTVADHVQCTLTQVPDYSSYTFPQGVDKHLPVNIDAYKTNASLAIQLAHAWLKIAKINTLNRNRKKQVANGTIIGQNGFIEDYPFVNDKNNIDTESSLIRSIPLETVTGLKECKWPGRYQVIPTDYANFYLDGAHTKESMEICAQWFDDNNRNVDKILIFSTTGDRDAHTLLNPLRTVKFAKVFFVIPRAFKTVSEKSDNYSLMEQEYLVERCQSNAQVWKDFDTNTDGKIFVMECVSDAIINIKQSSKNNESSVLVTGSLHLVGAALSILDSSFCAD